MRQLRQLAWPCIVAGLIIALTWPIYVEGVRSDALAQASLLVLLTEASTVSLANQLDRVAVLKGFRDAHALNIPAGVALGAALALFGEEERQLFTRALAVLVMPPQIQDRVQRLHRQVDRLMATMPAPTDRAAGPPGGSWRPLMREEIHDKEHRPAKTAFDVFDHGGGR